MLEDKIVDEAAMILTKGRLHQLFVRQEEF